VQRDLRQYIAKNSARHIPVGYSAADVREVLQDTWAYLQCAISGDSNDQSRSEIFGLNSYSWCGADATYTSAGYDTLVAMFKSSSVPVFFSEYGCNKPAGQPRPFNEVQALYGPQMTGLNGGLVYEYSEETSDYGLVTINSDGSIKLKADYENLQSQYNKLDQKVLTTVSSQTNSVPKCDSSLITNSAFSSNFTLPAQPDGAAGLITSGVKNAQQGKLVDVTNLNVKQAVQNSAGKALTGLTLKKVSSANTPGGGNAATGTTSSSNSTTTKKAAAPGLEVNRHQLGLAGAVVAAMALL
jgi:hypothetical protein